MIQGCDGLRFDRESSEPIRIVGHRRLKHFDGDVAVEAGVVGAIDLAHATGTDGGRDLVRAKASTGSQRHGPTPAWARGSRGGAEGTLIGIEDRWDEAAG